MVVTETLSVMGKERSKLNDNSVMKNILWMVSDKLAKILLGTVVNIIVARHLGPEVFGVLSYGLALNVFISTIANFGSKDYLITKFTQEPENLNFILFTSLIFLLMTNLFAFTIGTVYVSFSPNLSSPEKISVIVMLSSALLQFSLLGSFLNESRLQSFINVKISFKVLIVSSLLKLTAIYWGVQIFGFFLIYSFESFCLLFLFFLNLRSTPRIKWERRYFDRNIFRRILSDCWPLCLSSLSVVGYMKIDQIMIGEMLTFHALGVYSAAARVSEFFYIFGTAIVASVFPRLIEKKNNGQQYQIEVESLTRILILIAIVLTMLVAAFSETIILMSFGSGYEDAMSVLGVHMFACAFVYIGVMGSRWYLINGLSKLLFLRSVSALVLNVILNYLFLTKYGIVAAAYTTVASYVLSALLFDAFDKRTRPLFLLKLSGFNVVKTIYGFRGYWNAIF